jgi:DHA2 family multidrug resistance protein
LNLRLLRDRNFAIGLALLTIYGMLNFTPMVLLPQYAGFADALVGQVIGCRGLGMTVGFLIAGLTSRLDPRIGTSAGFLMQVLSGARMLTFDLNVTVHILILTKLGTGLLGRPDLGAAARRLPGRGLHLALGLPHAGAGWHLGLPGPAPGSARRRQTERH